MSSGASSQLGIFTLSPTFQSYDSLKNIRNLSLDATGRAVIEQPAPHWLKQAWTDIYDCCCNAKSGKPKCDATTFSVLVQALSNLQERNLEAFKTDIQTKRIFCNLNRSQRNQVVGIITQKISPNIEIKEEKKSDSEKDQPLLASKHATLAPATLERKVPEVQSEKQEVELSPPPPAQPMPAASTSSIVSVSQLYAFRQQKKKDDSESSGEEFTHRPTQESSINWQQDYERAMEMLTEKNKQAQQRQPALITSPPQQAPLPQADQDALRRRPLKSVETGPKETGTIIPNFGIKVLPDEKKM